MPEREAGLRDPVGRVAIVTGGASGIGRAVCGRLARAGARVVVVDVTPARVEETLDELRGLGAGPGDLLGLTRDVRLEEQMEEMARATLERFDRIDVLVACAGILRGRGSVPKPLAQISVDEWDQVLDTNLKGMFLSNRAVLPAMLRQRSGDIVNLSSTSGRQGRPLDGPYSASKFGVVGMSEALAEEVRSHGVRVQVLMPDAVDTAIWDQNGPVAKPANALPPERVADLILFMISQPDDTILLGTVIAPFRSRRRAAPRPPEAARAGDLSPEAAGG